MSNFPDVYQNQVFYKDHGRFYKNPRRVKEIWCTIGLGFENKQIYPQLEPWTQEFVNEEQFSQFIQFLEKEFKDSPTDLSMCGQTCAITFFCFCGCLYFLYRRRKMKLFRLRTIAAFNDLVRGMGIRNVRLHFTVRITPGLGLWIDSRNQPLEFGPPLGFSIIFTLENEIVWPPGFVIQQRQIVSSVPPPYVLKELDESNPVTEFEKNNFCTNCGRKCAAEHKFCGKCGLPLQ